MGDRWDSGSAILGCPLIWRQWPVGYDVLTNVAIVVMRLVGLALASVEQRDTRRNASSVSRLLALRNPHQRVDGRGRVRARERQHGIAATETCGLRCPVIGL